MDLETYLHKQSMLKDLNRNLQHLEKQLTLQGGEMYATPELVNSIRITHEVITKVEKEIADMALSLIENDPTIKEEFYKLQDKIMTIQHENMYLKLLIYDHMSRYNLLRDQIELAREYKGDINDIYGYMTSSKTFLKYCKDIADQQNKLGIKDIKE